jgi:ATP:ADP antiporter, AAA family
VPTAAERAAWFASLNGASAAAILSVQLFATGRALRRLGVPIALRVLPVIAFFSMAVVGVRPVPGAIAIAEILRKVVNYGLARPAREVLWTVLSTEEKYTAKLAADTALQRVGDVLAAAAFQMLVPMAGMGARGMAIACAVACVAWLAAAVRLGRGYEGKARDGVRKKVTADLPILTC